MCQCCGVQTNRFNAECETCFTALLEGRDIECKASHTAPEYIAKDSYDGRYTATAGKRFRVTTWEARELAEFANEGSVFESCGHIGGVETFVRTRYVADAAGNLHGYGSDGAKKIVHPAERKLRILTH